MQIINKYYLIAHKSEFLDTNKIIAGLDLLETFMLTHVSSIESKNVSTMAGFPLTDPSSQYVPWPQYSREASALRQKWVRVAGSDSFWQIAKKPLFYELKSGVTYKLKNFHSGVSLFTLIVTMLKATMYRELGVTDLLARTYRNSLNPVTYSETLAEIQRRDASPEDTAEHTTTTHYLTVGSGITEGLKALWHSAQLSGINLQVSFWSHCMSLCMFP